MSNVLAGIPKILHLDVSGYPVKWINYERASYYYAKDLVEYATGEYEYELRGGTRAIDGKRSILTLNTIIFVKGQVAAKHMHRGPKTVPLKNPELFARDKHVCAYCGTAYKGSSAIELNLTRDHIHPVSQGGPDTWMNVVTSCKRCNHHKNDRTPEQAGMELLYVPYTPNKYEYMILSNRKILADQMDFLLSGVPEDSRLRS